METAKLLKRLPKGQSSWEETEKKDVLHFSPSKFFQMIQHFRMWSSMYVSSWQWFIELDYQNQGYLTMNLAKFPLNPSVLR